MIADMESNLDAAIDTLFGLAKASQAADIAQQVKKLGHGPVRAIREWADCHARAGLGAEIRWNRGKDLRYKLLVQERELQQLRKMIDERSGETVTTLQVVGELFAANVEAKNFRMRLEDGETIRGSFSDAISEAQKAELPHRYRAELTKTVQVNYATDEEQVIYRLTALVPPGKSL